MGCEILFEMNCTDMSGFRMLRPLDVAMEKLMSLGDGDESVQLLRDRTVSKYRVIHKTRYIGWMDLDLGCCTSLLGQYVGSNSTGPRAGNSPNPSPPNPCI